MNRTVANLMGVADHEHHLCKAVRPAVLLESALVEYARDAFPLTDGFEIPPAFTRLELVHSPTPLVVLNEARGRHAVATAHCPDS